MDKNGKAEKVRAGGGGGERKLEKFSEVPSQ